MSRTKNAAAVALGRMARGVPKTLTDQQRQALADRMRQMHQRKAAEKAVDGTLRLSVTSQHEDQNTQTGEAQTDPGVGSGTAAA